MDPATMALIASTVIQGANAFSSGNKDKYEQKSRLNKQQDPVLTGLINSVQGPGAGGAFGTAADYYRDLMSDDSSTFNSMVAPEMRRFREDIIPDLSEQFAGMGSGGLSSSGFRNAAVNAGTDLSERLGAIRANLRSQGAQGLTNIGNSALGDYTNNVFRPAPDLGLEDIGKTMGNFASTYSSGNNSRPISPSTNAQIPISSKGSSSPYGGPASKSLPNFNYNPR